MYFFKTLATNAELYSIFWERLMLYHYFEYFMNCEYLNIVVSGSILFMISYWPHE